ncbi:DUF4176 domain-containing protein [Lachnobacterium bovis]|uniref:DUF4176 domain-containing protein n=1 Tax=Lachnobacterium bovis TaxID=140626 RepID=UPI0003B68F8C|nr:DUF4176 domain-containing protein [Lachnobacterium bovis]
MTSKEYRLALWKEYLKKVDFISEREKENLDAIAKKYFDDQSFLLEIYKAFAKNLDYLEDQETHVHYEKDGSDYILALENIETVFDREHFAKVIAAMLDLLEEMLPLGTVVDLDPETMKLAGEKVNEEKAKAGGELIDVDAVENFRMVITHRFLGSDGKYYYPYAGVVYPTGMPGSREVFYFTRAFVENIVQKGYEDELELQFQYMMKKELIVNKGMCTVGYTSPETAIELNKKITSGKLHEAC